MMWCSEVEAFCGWGWVKGGGGGAVETSLFNGSMCRRWKEDGRRKEGWKEEGWKEGRMEGRKDGKRRRALIDVIMDLYFWH